MHGEVKRCSVCSIIYQSGIQKGPKCPSLDNDWIKKRRYLYTREYYSAIKKDEILPFVTTGMNPEGIKPGEVNETEKDKYHTIALICGM